MPQSVKTLRPEIRPLSVKTDLNPVADLIDLCFSNQMDQDGLEYLRYIRQVGGGSRAVRWADGSHERVSIPLFGYVWIENEKIIGNISLSPFQLRKEWYYLIANVAVHPDHRRQGIARCLTQQAIAHVKKRKAGHLWLQVKDFNQAAIQLYDSLGFVHRDKRNTWRSVDYLYPPEVENRPDIKVVPRIRRDWNKQKQWLLETYPEAVRWYFGFYNEDIAPGFMRSLENLLLYERVMHHFSVYFKHELIGVLTHQPVNKKIHHLYLGIPNNVQEDIALRSLLSFALRMYGDQRVLRINFPCDRGETAFEDSNFNLQNTLIWMSLSGYN
ncbi:MAG: GNAT family N-acetyltransferase [Anaerolineaceae bacterium]|nr:GNAT family N-acetyltransferase [Anaerolineaceae bacterium]